METSEEKKDVAALSKQTINLICEEVTKCFQCSLCCQVKPPRDLGYFRECGHFFCLHCLKPDKFCTLCIHFGSMVLVSRCTSTFDLISNFYKIAAISFDNETDAVEEGNVTGVDEINLEVLTPKPPGQDIPCSVVPETQIGQPGTKLKPVTVKIVRNEFIRTPEHHDKEKASPTVPITISEDNDIFSEDSLVSQCKRTNRKRKRDEIVTPKRVITRLKNPKFVVSEERPKSDRASTRCQVVLRSLNDHVIKIEPETAVLDEKEPENIKVCKRRSVTVKEIKKEIELENNAPSVNGVATDNENGGRSGTKQRRCSMKSSEKEVVVKETPKRTRKSDSALSQAPSNVKTSSAPNSTSVTPNPTVGKKLNSSVSSATTKRNAKGETPIHVAIRRNNLRALEEYLDNGMDPNLQDFAGWAPLHDGVCKGSLEMVSCLLKRGAIVDACGLNNTTALHLAVDVQNLPMTRLLLQHGADINARDIFGKTPLEMSNGSELHTVLRFEGRKRAVSPTAKALIPQRMVIFVLSKDSILLHEAQLFSARYKIPLEKKDFYKATHIILHKEDSFDSFDWSLLRAIAKGATLVSSSWLQLATDELHLPPECIIEPAWMPGLRQSQRNARLRRPGLFSGCSVMLPTCMNSVSSYSVFQGKINVKDLRSLVVESGAKILLRIPDPECPITNPFVPYHAKPGALERCSQYVIYFPGVWEPPVKYNMPHLKCFPVHWLIDSLLNFELIPNRDKYF